MDTACRRTFCIEGDTDDTDSTGDTGDDNPSGGDNEFNLKKLDV
jgi:hypothetical protein